MSRLAPSFGLGIVLAAGCGAPKCDHELAAQSFETHASHAHSIQESWGGDLLLYGGPGVSERAKVEMPLTLVGSLSLKRVRWISDATLWEATPSNSIFIMPGGADLPYLRELKGEPNQRIRSFVEQGGSYLGFCAGAYYASSRVEFDLGGDLEVVGRRELNFFPGTARGPLYRSYSYKDDEGAGVATLRWCLPESEPVPELKVYFNGGCEFVDADRYPDVTVLARYADLPGEPAAIIKCQVGKGWAILSGAHPELDLSSASLKTSRGEAIKSELEQHSIGRRWLTEKLLNLLK